MQIERRGKVVSTKVWDRQKRLQAKCKHSKKSYQQIFGMVREVCKVCGKILSFDNV